MKKILKSKDKEEEEEISVIIGDNDSELINRLKEIITSASK